MDKVVSHEKNETWIMWINQSEHETKLVNDTWKYIHFVRWPYLKFLFLGEVGACGNRALHMREPRGTISGANFTAPYSANSSCTWIIMLPHPSKVSLRITSFNVYSNSKHCGGTNCRCDFLQIKEQDSIQNSTGFNEKFCNDFPPKRVYSLMSRVKIRLVSHSLKEGFGFSLSYEATDSSSIDFVPVTAALGSGQAGGARYSENQTETKAQSKSPRNSNSSGVDVPLSALTSKPPMKLKLSSESSVLPSVAKVSPTTLSRTVTGATKSDKIWTSPVVIVHAVEQKEVEEIVPDIIVLGPSVPVVVIFVLVVMGIAWWNYKFNSEELNRCCLSIFGIFYFSHFIPELCQSSSKLPLPVTFLASRAPNTDWISTKLTENCFLFFSDMNLMLKQTNLRDTRGI